MVAVLKIFIPDLFYIIEVRIEAGGVLVGCISRM
jgi:hypothetical protein